MQFAKRVHLGQVRDRPGGVRKRKPDAVGQAEAGVAVHRQAEGTPEQLGFDQAAQRRALALHRRARCTAKPRQGGADALPADQRRHPLGRVHRRVAHQVHALRVGASAEPGAARVHQRHEHQPHRLQLPVQRVVPAQPHHQAAQVGNGHLGTDALQPMHAAKEAHRRRIGPAAAERERMHRKALIPHHRFAQHPLRHVRAREFDERLQFEQFGEGRCDHAGRIAGRAAIKTSHCSCRVDRCFAFNNPFAVYRPPCCGGWLSGSRWPARAGCSGAATDGRSAARCRRSRRCRPPPAPASCR